MNREIPCNSCDHCICIYTKKAFDLIYPIAPENFKLKLTTLLPPGPFGFNRRIVTPYIDVGRLNRYGFIFFNTNA
jgi:hypothetical protein